MVRIDKVYTRGGDQGQTSLIGGDRVSKGDLRIDCYGTVDELNAVVGMANAWLSAGAAGEKLVPVLTRVQSELFNLGCHLAAQEDYQKELPQIRAAHITQLEKDIDDAGEGLPPLTSFVLPGGNQAAATLHLARTVCRRAERLVVSAAAHMTIDENVISYLNRLSDACFVFARYAAHADGADEILWDSKNT